MRLDSVVIRNYRGLRHVELHGLADEPALTVVGVNGSGKTLLLQAIKSVWSAQYTDIMAPDERSFSKSDVGPFGDNVVIRLDLALEPPEVQAIDDWRASQRWDRTDRVEPPGSCPSVISAEFTAERYSYEYHISKESPTDLWARALFSPTPRKDFPFWTIEHLPAHRQLVTEDEPSPNLRLVGQNAKRFPRPSEKESVFSLVGFLPWLATIDYLELTAQREGRDPPQDFVMLADRFEQATGKRLERPQTRPGSGMQMLVRLPSGERHDLSSLSDGEQQVLALMYFARRTSATGGILLIDEPELHLHPSLQQALVEVLQLMSDRAQVWVATHAAKVIAASPLGELVHLHPSHTLTGNQARLLAEEAERLHLHQELGLDASDLLNNDLLVIVEGPTDWHRLRRFFPTELGRAAHFIANGKEGVLRAVEVLKGSPQVLPWVAIVDRDFTSEQQLEAWAKEHSNLFVWSRRMLENVLLEPDLLAAVMSNSGRPCTTEQMRAELYRLAMERRNEVLRMLISRALDAAAGNASKPKHSDAVRQLRLQLERDKGLAEEKQERLKQVATEQAQVLDAQWGARWPTLVHGKSVLAALAKSPTMSPYRDLESLIDAMVVHCQYVPADLPDDLQRLKMLLRGQMRALDVRK